MSYEIGKVYPFKVKKKFTSQTEIIDEATGTTTYLHNTEKLNLPRGLEVKCRVVGINASRPIVELVDLEDFKYASGLTEAKLCELLEEYNFEWDTADFVKLLLAEDSEESFESQCYQWLHEISKKYELKSVWKNISDILELSSLLDLCGPAQREYYQDRLTILLEIINNYNTAVEFITTDKSKAFIESLLKKLRVSGFVFHPDKNFSILASIFMLQPEIMSECIGELLETIRMRNISNWKQEPFNTALSRLLEMYIRKSVESIDRKKEPEKSEIIKNSLTALAIQLMLQGEHNASLIDHRISSARLCTVSTYINTTGMVKLLDNAFAYLFYDDTRQLNFQAIRIETIPYIIANHLPEGFLDSKFAFTAGNAKVVIDSRGISLRAADSDNLKPVFPNFLSLWKGLQVFLDVDINTSLPSSAAKELKPFEDAWTEVETVLFAPRQVNQVTHHVGETVKISFVRQDTLISSKFHCKILDEIGGKGFIYVKPDIVPYTVHNPSLTTFLGKYFNAEIIDVDNDGNFHFSLVSDIKSYIGEVFAYGDEITCWLGKAPNKKNRLAPAVSSDGLSVTIEVPEDLMSLNLTQGSIVKARVMRETPPDDASHIYAEVIDSAPSDNFYVADAFNDLMNAVSFEVDENEWKILEKNEDSEIEKELDEEYVHQIIFFIDRLAMLDPDYVKSYNYLWYAEILSRMIGRDKLASYYNGRKGIISMLHYFAKNNTLDEDRLSSFEINNSDELSNDSPLRERFLQLQAVGYLNRPNHDADLAAMAEKYPKLRTLARLVLAYNIVKEVDMIDNANDIHNKIKQILNLKGFDTNLKYYGVESDVVEFKTSLVFPAGDRFPNHDKQMAVILGVINSFLNTNGGTLYVGVNDVGMGVGVEQDIASSVFNHDKDKYLRAITDAVAMRWGNYVATFISAKYDPENTKKDVLVVSVKPNPDGVPMPDGKYLVRIDSTKRTLTKAEFEQFRQRNGAIADSSFIEEESVGGEEEKPEDASAESAKAQPIETQTFAAPKPSPDAIATSRIRKNILEDWEDYDSYVPPVAFIKFLKDNKYVKMDEFDYDRSAPLTLTILDDEQRSFLVLGYENGMVLRVPIDEIMEFDSSIRSRFSGSKLLFASIARPEDYLLSILQESKSNGKVIMRADRVDSFPECGLQDSGDLPCNESLISHAVAFDILPASMKADFSGIIDLGATRSGYPLNERTRLMVEKLHELGICEI